MRTFKGTNILCQKSSYEIIALVEAEEMTRNATSCSTAALAASKSSSLRISKPPVAGLMKEKATCPHCLKGYFKYKKGKHGWNKKPHSMCTECYRNRKKSQQDLPENKISNATLLGQITSISHHSSSCYNDEQVQLHACNIAPIRPSHHIFTKGEWKKA